MKKIKLETLCISDFEGSVSELVGKFSAILSEHPNAEIETRRQPESNLNGDISYTDYFDVVYYRD